MRKPDTFTKTIYVVAWAGCTIPLTGRTFETIDLAEQMFEVWMDKPGIRIERMRAAFVFDTFVTKEKYLKNKQKAAQSSGDML